MEVNKGKYKILTKTLTLFIFPIFCTVAYIMKDIPETSRAH